jgi:molecular chaperone HtpG
VRLYVRRVFVTDEAQELLPAYLRFLKGVVDSEDLPLNISRETLQANPMIAKIRQGLVKRVLGDLAKKAAEAPEEYAKFWDNFGAVLKEGLYEDFEQRQALLGLARFRSTAVPGLTSLEDYVKRMKIGQKHIFTIAGDAEAMVSRSPQLEGFRAKGVEVLLLTDPVDEFWTASVPRFQEFDFKSVTRGSTDLSEIAGTEETPKAKPETPKQVSNLVAYFKITLADAVKDVRVSDRLTESPVCLVADEGDTEIHLQRLLKQHNRAPEGAKPVFELNAEHPLIAGLAEKLSGGDMAMLEDAAWLLLDQARIVEGEPVPDPTAFARRLSNCVARGMAG